MFGSNYFSNGAVRYFFWFRDAIKYSNTEYFMNKAIWEHLDYVNGTLWVVQTHYVYPRVNIHNELSLI